jgi:hypothetical protein
MCQHLIISVCVSVFHLSFQKWCCGSREPLSANSPITSKHWQHSTVHSAKLSLFLLVESCCRNLLQVSVVVLFVRRATITHLPSRRSQAVEIYALQCQRLVGGYNHVSSVRSNSVVVFFWGLIAPAFDSCPPKTALRPLDGFHAWTWEYLVFPVVYLRGLSRSL